jgi:hypothetical protein
MTYVSVEIDGEDVNGGEDFERLTVSGPAVDGFTCKHCGNVWDEGEDRDEVAQDLCPNREACSDDACPCDETTDHGTHELTVLPLSWLNHAGVSFDEGEDAVTVSISVGDPRGAFTFTVRRVPDDADGPLAGKLIMHMPYPGEGTPHVETRELHPGTLIIGN